MTPVPEPRSRPVYATATFAVFHIGEAAFLLSKHWPLLTIRHQNGKPAYYFELRARKDLQLYTDCIDEIRAIRERMIQSRRQHRTSTGEPHAPADHASVK